MLVLVQQFPFCSRKHAEKAERNELQKMVLINFEFVNDIGMPILLVTIWQNIIVNIVVNSYVNKAVHTIWMQKDLVKTVQKQKLLIII